MIGIRPKEYPLPLGLSISRILSLTEPEQRASLALSIVKQIGFDEFLTKGSILLTLHQAIDENSWMEKGDRESITKFIIAMNEAWEEKFIKRP